MAIETVRVSQKARDQLITLKRRTNIENWNVLCRWAFCTSLAEPSIPPDANIITDSSIEMTWRVFGGVHADLYMALLKERCKRDGLGTGDEVLVKQFRLHLHRGIGYLFGDKSLSDLNSVLTRSIRQSY